MNDKKSTWVFTLVVGGIKYEYEIEATTEEEAESKAIAFFMEQSIGENQND